MMERKKTNMTKKEINERIINMISELREYELPSEDDLSFQEFIDVLSNNKPSKKKNLITVKELISYFLVLGYIKKVPNKGGYVFIPEMNDNYLSISETFVINRNSVKKSYSVLFIKDGAKKFKKEILNLINRRKNN